MATLTHDKKNHAARVDLTLTDLAEIYATGAHEANADHVSAGTDEAMASLPASWYGGLQSTAEAIQIMREGWKQGTERLSGFKGTVAGDALGAKSRRRVGRWADSGDSLNVDRALRGDWDQAWRTARREWAPGTTHVDLVVAWGGNASLSADDMFWNGAALCVAADILEDAGYTVRIRAAMCAYHYGSKNYSAQVVTVKEFADPLNVDGVASVFCHAGIFRTFGFRAILAMPFDVGRGLGSHLDVKHFAEKVPSLSADLVGESLILIDNVRSKEDAVAAIRKVIAKVQGEGKEAA